MRTRDLLMPSLFIFAAMSPLVAQHYSKKILLKGLAAPTGIAVHSSGDLYFTQVPESGKFSSKNLVSHWDSKSMKVQTLVSGEPAPTNIVALPDRTLYWTCVTAGVIMMRKGSSQAPARSGLKNPTGIAVGPRGGIYFTQIPTPGVPGTKGGKNELTLLSGKTLTTLAMGEPEPKDVVVDAKGNAYWTCRTAGVILRRDAVTTKITKILDGLEKPVGIAMDGMGDLYFTEVPTPGMSGAKGGRNKVWRYSPMANALTLVSFGEPYPADVAVSSDGSRVYWTCMTAGVILEATRSSTPALISSMSPSGSGQTVQLALSSRAHAGMTYQAATSFGLGPIPVDSRYMALAPDGLFFLTLLGMGKPVFSGFGGKLDAMGKSMASITLPREPIFKGIHLYTAFVVLDSKSPTGIAGISNSHRLVIQ
jgi:hypothetical protein